MARTFEENMNDKKLTVKSLRVLQEVEGGAFDKISSQIEETNQTIATLQGAQNRYWDSIADDNIITAEEKRILYKEKQTLDTEYSIVIQNAEKNKDYVDYSRLTEAYQNLNSYLAFIKVFENLGSNTKIDNRTEFYDAFDSYYIALNNVNQAILNKASVGDLNVGNPDKITGLKAVASEKGIYVSFNQLSSEVKNNIGKYIYKLNKGDGVLYLFESQINGFTYEFDRLVDGFPEADDIKDWEWTVSAVSVYGKENEESNIATVNVDTYGTWIPKKEDIDIILSSNKRQITFSFNRTVTNKILYGQIQYGLLVQRIDIDGDNFYTPALDKNPALSEENYKQETTEPLYVTSYFSQTVPLAGQNNKKWRKKYYVTREGEDGTKADSVSYSDTLPAFPDNAVITYDDKGNIIGVSYNDTIETFTRHYEYTLVEMPSPVDTTYKYKIDVWNKDTNLHYDILNPISVIARANSASDLVDNAITQNALAPEAVTADKIAAGTISAEKLAAEDILAKGARAGMVSTEGLQVDNAGFFASKPFVYNYIDPLTQEEKTYVTTAGEFFVGNSPDIDDKREGVSFFHFKKGFGFFIRIAEFAVRGLSTIIENIFRVKKAGESDLTALMVVNSTDSMDILSGTPARSSRVNGLLKTKEFIAEKFIVQESGVNSLYVMLQDESFNLLRNVIVTKKNLKIIEESGWIWSSEHKGKFKADYFMGNLEPPIYHESYTSLYVGNRLYSFGDYGRAYNEIIYSDDDGDTWNIIATKWQDVISHAFYYEDYFYIVLLHSGAIFKCNQDFTLTEQVIEIFDYTGYIVNLLFFGGYFYLFTSDKVYRTLDFSSLEIVLQGTFLNSELYKDIMIVYNYSEWFVSKDGSFWKSYNYIDSGLESFSCLCATDKYIVAGTGFGNVYLSVDGVNWTIIKTSLENRIAKIYFYENYLYLVVRLENENFYTIYFLSVDNELLLIDDKNTTALNTWSAKYITESLETQKTEIQAEIETKSNELQADIETKSNELQADIDKLKTYSTEEKRIGTWIDGKGFYRKCFEISFNKSIEIIHGLNFYEIISIKGSIDAFNSAMEWQQSYPLGKIDNENALYQVYLSIKLTTLKIERGSKNVHDNFKTKLIIDYTKIEYTISFNANGGSGEMLPINAEVIPANAFTKEGYTFVIFNTKADGSGISYYPGDRITLTENITLYAIWQEAVSIPAGTYSPSVFRSLISQFISTNGNRTVAKEFSATVNGQTITIPANAKIYHNTSYSRVEMIGFDSTDYGIVGGSFSTYKHYIVSSTIFGLSEYANYNITIDNIIFV